MREHLGFLKASSTVVKIAAWIFLFFGILGGVSILFGGAPAGSSRWVGLVVLVVYTFLFFFLFLIAKIADLLTKIINEIKKE
jgi:phage-related protein